MIDINKEYTTRSGLPVRIYATDCGGTHPIQGSMFREDVWASETWTAEGTFYGKVSTPHDYDLVEVPEIQDKDIVVAWDEGAFYGGTGFYDKENNCLFDSDGTRNGLKYGNYKLAPKPSKRLLDLKSKLKD